MREAAIPPRFQEAHYLAQTGPLDAGADAHLHFETSGYRHGLAGSPACDQGYFLRMIQHMEPASILEIGPGNNPKMHGSNVAYFDVKSAEELRARYASQDGASRVPETIHFESSTGDLGEVDARFDVVFSCHMIEHALDLVDHLAKVERLLNPGGHYFVIAPNRDYTFDHFKPLSTAEDVIAHHAACDGDPRLSVHAYLLETLRRTHNDAPRHWRGDHGAWQRDADRVSVALRNYSRINSDRVARSGYHSWFFNDRSFARLMDDLFDLEVTGLKLMGAYNSLRNTCSFNAILRRVEP